jgi:CheY-like chemotaxis protein
VTVPDSRAGAVKMDRGQLEQIIMNLAVNARDAMPHGGQLVIDVAGVVVDDAHLRQHPQARPGPHVLLAVRDNGYGMDAETQSRIFEPFFTTKRRGKGTGLGLATVYGIVVRCGGHVVVESAVGAGTTFRVYLPRVESVPSATPTPDVVVPMGRGTETVLLVEDEDVVRNMIRDVLQHRGYTVIEARHGAEALEIAAGHAGSIDLLVTDVVMPHVGGGELAQRLLAQRPDLRVLFISGYTDDAVVRHGVERGSAFLQKPFSLESFGLKVREVLDAPEQSAA